jgi:hypothetical protein
LDDAAVPTRMIDEPRGGGESITGGNCDATRLVESSDNVSFTATLV